LIFFDDDKAPQARLVVLESGLGLESGLESIFAGLGLEMKGLGLFLLSTYSALK